MGKSVALPTDAYSVGTAVGLCPPYLAVMAAISIRSSPLIALAPMQFGFFLQFQSPRVGVP